MPKSANDAPREMDSLAVRAWIKSGKELGFVDVTEEGQFGEAHPLLAVNAPYSKLELMIGALVPRLDTPTVIVGDASVAARAVRRLTALGYTDVYVLTGGHEGWKKAGFPLFASINVPSKAFSEVVEQVYHTPDITPEDFVKLTKTESDLVLIDTRTEEEFARFHVPTAISAPGAEIVNRFADLVPSKDTTVVVSCGGRTRGIIGAQALLDAGVTNKILVLKGGTQGWALSGFQLNRGVASKPYTPSNDVGVRAKEYSRTVAARFGIKEIDEAGLATWRADKTRTTFIFDVRTPKEYAIGHYPESISAQSGQLVQAVDKWAGVRNARLVLVDDGPLVRANVTAHWMDQLGWEVRVLNGNGKMTDKSVPSVPAIKYVDEITCDEVAKRSAARAVYVDASADYRAAHPVGAVWSNRAKLDQLPPDVLGASELIVFSSDGRLAQLAALDLKELTKAKVFVCAGGMAEWQKQGRPTATSSDPKDADRIDFLFWNHDRLTGNAKSSSNYLKWEEELPQAIAADGLSGFRMRGKTA